MTQECLFMPEGVAPTSSDFRAAMAHVAAPVHIITTLNDGLRYGMTATAVCSVIDTPPRLLVCINRAAQSHAHFLKSGILAVNVISVTDQDLAGVFAGGMKEMSARFERGAWQTLKTGAPTLASALATFDCRIVETFRQESHDMMLVDVVALACNVERTPLLYFDRSFTTILPVSSRDSE